MDHVFHAHSHDPADSIDGELEASADGIRTVKLSLLVLLVTAVIQLLLVAVTGSVALLADTVHNFSDALTAVPLWIAFHLSRRAPTRRYTHGYGRAEDLAGLFIVLMIAISALVAGVESVRRLLDPQPVHHVAVVVLAGLIGFAGNEAVAVFRIRVGRRIGSSALVADGMHARTDGFTSLAVVLGALGVLAGQPLADPIVGLVITAAILVVLKGTATESLRRLMDGVDPGHVSAAEHALEDLPEVLAVHELRLRWSGHRMRVEAVVDVEESLSLREVEVVVQAARHQLEHALPKMSSATIATRVVSPPRV